MSGVQVNCPGCGAPIVFRLGSSLVTVCEFCHSVVARGDRSVDDLGKIAFLAETDSPLEVGHEGTISRERLRSLRRGAAGPRSGRHVGRMVSGLRRRPLGLAGRGPRPVLSHLCRAGQRQREASRFRGIAVVATDSRSGRKIRRCWSPRKASGRPIGARGEIPYRLVPGELYEYADLSGPGGRFGTLDYSDDPPSLYLGQEVTLDELNLPHREESYRA